MRRVLTYGTFDLLHWGHIRLLKRAKELGDYLIVGLSTDDFNEAKPGKQPSYHPYEVRKMMLESLRYVDMVIPEMTWDQKVRNVQDWEVDVVVMGSDWEGSPRFEHLRDHCEVQYLPRTEGTSTSDIRRDLLFEAIEYKKQDQRRAAAQQADRNQDDDEGSAHPPGTEPVPGTQRMPILSTPPRQQNPFGGQKPGLPQPPSQE